MQESSRSGRSPSMMLQRMTHASERGAAARESRRGSRIAAIEKFVGSVRFHTHVQHVLSDDRLSFGSEGRSEIR